MDLSVVFGDLDERRAEALLERLVQCADEFERLVAHIRDKRPDEYWSCFSLCVESNRDTPWSKVWSYTEGPSLTFYVELIPKGYLAQWPHDEPFVVETMVDADGIDGRNDQRSRVVRQAATPEDAVAALESAIAQLAQELETRPAEPDSWPSSGPQRWGG